MLAEKEKCTGCGSCAVSCPNNCITMAANSEGFRFPLLDIKKCVNCQLCVKSCPILTGLSVSEETEIIAAKNRNVKVRSNSSSGGIFWNLAESVIAEGGVVCAAQYDEEFTVVHAIAQTISQIAAFQGAKYAQSKVEHCFCEIKNLLEDGIKVLFVGTPCQTAGIYKYLKRQYDNLILIDTICHGVPSPKVWKIYLNERRSKDAGGSEISRVNLRSKSTGWSYYTYSVEVIYKNGTIYSVRQNEDEFMQGFVNNLYLRNSCSNCKFKGIQRCSDLTLGDYWGVWEQYPQFDDNQGCSLLMIHTDKGSQIWNGVKSQFEVIRVDENDALKSNPSALYSSSSHRRRADFFRGMENGEEVIPLIQGLLVKNRSEKSSNLLVRSKILDYVQLIIKRLKGKKNE